MHLRSEYRSQPLIFRTLRGHLVVVRQATAADTFLLAELLCQLSKRTLHFRYMRSGCFPAEAIWSEAVRMTRGHTTDHTTLVATIRPNECDEVVAVAELVRDRQDLAVGEVALVVRDAEQQQGIGSFLLWRLIELARHGGIANLSASMLAENSAMLGLIGSLGLPFTATTRYGVTQVLVSILAHPEKFALARSARKLAA